MKVVGWIVGILILVVVGAVTYLVLNSGSLIKTGLEEYGPGALGADVNVDEVNLSLADGSAQVLGFEIGNPAGFVGPHAMKLDEIKVVLDAEQISEELIVLKQIVIDGADVAAVAKGQRTNFQQLLENVEKAVGGSDGGASDTSSAAGPKFIVDRLDFTNASASLSSDVLGEVAVELPDIRLTDIGRKSNGVTGAELAQQILKPVTDAVTREAVAQGLDIEGVKQRARERVQEKVSEGLRGLTDRLRN